MFAPFFTPGVNARLHLPEKDMTAYKLILFIHIISGMSAFVAAPVAMLVKKGAKNHRQFGKFYFWAMTFVVISGIIMSIYLKNLFLFFLAFFAYYLVVSGYRWIYIKQPGIKKIGTTDMMISTVAVALNTGLLFWGIFRILQNVTDPFGYISSVFGLIGINFAFQNFKQMNKPPKEKHVWLFNHMGGMLGGYISTVSAFSAVNFHFLPTIIQWLWPTIIGVPLMSAWMTYYRKKFKSGKKPEQLMELNKTSHSETSKLSDETDF